MNKPKTNQPQTPNVVQGKDSFSTPRYATELLLPYIPKYIEVVWECAAGDHKISNVLREHYKVFSSDIRLSEINNIVNFIYDPVPDPLILDWNATVIITNPPFSIKKQFFNKCIEYNLAFAILIPADYSLWVIDSIRKYGCKKLVPDHRINYVTPSGKSGKESAAQFHSMWLTRYFDLELTETFVTLDKKMKENV